MRPGDLRPTAFKALAVGNAHFPEDPHRLGRLNGPLNDVDAVCEALSTPGTGLFRCEPPLKDATAQAVLDGVDRFFTDAEPDDCLLLYYSGHGRVDVHGDFYLCARDTDSGKSLSTPRVTGDQLRKIAFNSPALLKVIVLDCCYADRFTAAHGDRQYVLAATRRSGNPLVPDAPGPDELSPFTAAFVAALRHAALDTDNDGLITAHDVARYICDLAATDRRVPFADEQWRGSGSVPVARSSPAPTARPVVQHVREPRESRTEAPTLPTPVAVRPGSLPDLLPVPPTGKALFHLGRHLVTNGQFRAFLLDDGNERWRPDAVRCDPAARDYLRCWDGLDIAPGRGHRPVVAVTPGAAAAYAAWAGRRLGLPLRLPRVDEWERAAAAGRDGDWPAEDVRSGRVGFRGTSVEPSDVGDFEANPYGVTDLLGNVWEICVDGAGRPVLRGGAFDAPAGRLLDEIPLPPDAPCRADTGFRCAC
ncbi:SUMF1/EgtB/PvdO family nonheme iron enzyme [Saccharothrix australiensis]|uniref:Formylglycine-generating enzyme required for sulfatase activity n=1 Tax=Saccharothrix australiensis TaxID=2072 RepID=A0A495W1Q3_9PSEU|nr:SUMF1/EgtB/PvdO family nonheme iron enzyme [Saccharothrix australiensis]RKT55556.1 formylglycine-generating enzyme required for sulfatase activity [Saccharothrix australiensis]